MPRDAEPRSRPAPGSPAEACSPRRPGDDWSDWSEAPEPEAVRGDWTDARPVCPRCLTEVGPLQHYCHDCGAAVGQFTPNIPFVNIPYMFEPLGLALERLWRPRHESRARRWAYGAILLAAAMAFTPVWLLLLAAPYWLLRRPRPRQGACAQCGYDLRGGHDRCPECGAAVDDADAGA
jgi:hypothetical protein